MCRGDEIVSFNQTTECKQASGRHGAAARHAAIGCILAARDQLLMIIGSEKESAAGIAEAGQHNLAQFAGPPEPFFIKVALIQFDQGIQQRGIIIQICGQRSMTVAPSVQQAPANLCPI